MINSWKKFLSVKANKNETSFTIIFFMIIAFVYPIVLQLIEERNGVTFADPILRLFTPIELTWITFTLIYGGLIAAVYHLLAFPENLMLAFRAYILLAIFRMIGMFLLPLNPPENIILLNDPFIQLFGTGDILTKDLFFSGHTSTMFLFFLTARTEVFKYIFLAATILIGLFVLLQHVHYSVDVFAAPFFAYVSYIISKRIKERFF